MVELHLKDGKPIAATFENNGEKKKFSLRNTNWDNVFVGDGINIRKDRKKGWHGSLWVGTSRFMISGKNTSSLQTTPPKAPTMRTYSWKLSGDKLQVRLYGPKVFEFPMYSDSVIIGKVEYLLELGGKVTPSRKKVDKR